MNQAQSCTGLVLVGIVSMAAAASCQDPPAEPVSRNASLTSVEVVAGAPPAEAAENGGDMACDAPSDGPVASASYVTAASPGAPKQPVTTTRESAKAKLAFAPTKEPRSDRGSETAALDEAIRQEVASGKGENVASSAPVTFDVTTTSATVTAPPPATAFAPSHVTFVNRLPSVYRLARLQMIVDGAVYYDGSSPQSVVVPAGDHAVQIIADYEIHESIFPSAGNARMEVQSAQTVHAGTGANFVATADPTGGVTMPMDKRVRMDWQSLAAR